MTPFSSVLECYMREKDIRVYSIAQYCGIDRSNMYKILNGKRNPTSEDMVERIAEYMRLRPKERDYLLEAYQITVMGYDAYHRRKSVQDFLLSFSTDGRKQEKTISRQEYMTVKVDEQELNNIQGIVVRDIRLRHMISSVLNLEIQKPSGTISLLMQPDNNFVMDILAFAGSKKEDLNIEHIFCLSNTDDIVLDKKDYNLSCLSDILPLFVHCVCNYKPYCYYDSIASHNNRFNFLSSMILTSQYVIAFSTEENMGVLLSGKETTQDLQKMFQSLKEDASLMACKMDSLEKQLNSYQNINFDNNGVGFQPEACLVPIMPITFLEKYLDRDLFSQQSIRDSVFQYIYESKKISDASKTTFIFTEQGIRRFIRNGRISELPESVYYPLEYNDRFLIIRRLMKECETGRYKMLRPETPIAEIDICVYSSMQDGYLLLPTVQGDRLFLEFRESGLLNAFRDYFESLDRKFFYSADETVHTLKRLLAEISFK